VRPFGSAINFYGGPGEAFHKSFVKAPEMMTQRRMCEFAKQTAGQYYNIMMVTKKATKCIGGRCNHWDDSDDSIQNVEGGDSECYMMQGEYSSMELPSDNCDEMKLKYSNKNLNKYGMHEDLIRLLHRIHSAKDNATKHQIVGYTWASIIDSEGEVIHFAHPNYHGGQWYDCAYVYYEVDDENGMSTAHSSILSIQNSGLHLSGGNGSGGSCAMFRGFMRVVESCGRVHCCSFSLV